MRSSDSTAMHLAGEFGLTRAAFDEEAAATYGIKTSFYVDPEDTTGLPPPQIASLQNVAHGGISTGGAGLYGAGGGGTARSGGPGGRAHEDEMFANMGMMLDGLKHEHSDAANSAHSPISMAAVFDPRRSIGPGGGPGGGEAAGGRKTMLKRQMSSLEQGYASTKAIGSRLTTRRRSLDDLTTQAQAGRIRLSQWKIKKRVDLGLGKRNSLKLGFASTAPQERLAAKQSEEFVRFLEDARVTGVHLYDIALGLLASLVLYDVACHSPAFFAHDAHGTPLDRRAQLLSVLGVHCVAPAALFLIARLAMGLLVPWTRTRTLAAFGLFCALHAVSLAVVIVVLRAEVGPCDALRPLPPRCDNVTALMMTGLGGGGGGGGSGGGGGPAGASSGWDSCLVSMSAGPATAAPVLYCERAPHAHLTTLLILQAALPYAFTAAMRMPIMVPAATLGTLLSLGALVLSEHVLSDPHRHFAPLDGGSWALLLFYLALAHLLGVAHHLARRTDVWESSALRLRHHRLLFEIGEETARCEQLLANIVPPHLLSALKAKLLDPDGTSSGSFKSTKGRGLWAAAAMTAKQSARRLSFTPPPRPAAAASAEPVSTTAESGSFSKVADTPVSADGMAPSSPKRSPKRSPGRGRAERKRGSVIDVLRGDRETIPATAPALGLGGLGVLVSESYGDCSILFSKIEGLDVLVNDESRAPAEVVHLLQRVFDKFDALSEMYGVQKVRKTANELSIFAAGLPDTKILPTPLARACGCVAFGFAMCAVMEKLNLDLHKWGVQLNLKIGIHSGERVIAGVVGHKTVQWDLCGDVVNTAARMCSYSKPGHVHVSEATYGFVQDTFAAVCRGEREIKGKGKMRTYFVLPLPANQNEILLTHCPPGLAPPPKAPDASFTA